jgi:hypothetical protein
MFKKKKISTPSQSSRILKNRLCIDEINSMLTKRIKIKKIGFC